MFCCEGYHQNFECSVLYRDIISAVGRYSLELNIIKSTEQSPGWEFNDNRWNRNQNKMYSFIIGIFKVQNINYYYCKNEKSIHIKHKKNSFTNVNWNVYVKQALSLIAYYESHSFKMISIKMFNSWGRYSHNGGPVSLRIWQNKTNQWHTLRNQHYYLRFLLEFVSNTTKDFDNIALPLVGDF